MGKEVFNRYEFKYKVHVDLYADLYKAMAPYLTTDAHGDAHGIYHVSNIYYDTDERLFYQETLNKQDFRQKLRLRVYDSVTGTQAVYLEIKKKCQGRVNKRRTGIALSDAYSILHVPPKPVLVMPESVTNPQIMREIYFLHRHYHLHPKATLSYERQAFVGIQAKDLRVTFDRNLRISEDLDTLGDTMAGDQFLPSDSMILEIKVDGHIPLWLARILSEFECYKQTFSKYAAGYKLYREVL